MIKRIFAITAISTTTSMALDEMPIGAKTGECFTKSFYPPKYINTTRVKSTKKVLINDESVKYEVIPTQYKIYNKKVKVSDGKEKIVVTPAQYRTVYERVLVKPSKKVWRKSLNINSPEAFKSCVDSAQKSGLDIQNALVGTCYYEHYQPATYRTVTSKILASEASERFEVIPAQYKKSFKKIVTDNTTIKLLPSVAVYKKVKDKVVIEPARTEWRKTICEDRGCSQSEVICLIEVPTTYKEITKRIVLAPAVQKKVVVKPIVKSIEVEELVSPARVKSLPIDATYKTVAKEEKLNDEKYFWTDSSAQYAKTRLTTQCDKICLTKTPAKYQKIAKRVLVKPATTKLVKTPAVYKNIQVKKLIKEASYKKVVIPAEYITVVTQRKRTKGYAKWIPVVCESTMTPNIIKKVQRALKFQGFYSGEINGVWDLESKSAARAYQKAKGLGVTSKLSIETMKALEIY